VSWCSTCGALLGSAADLAAHKRSAHRADAMLRQPARRRVVAAALALVSAIALADCDDPAPAWAAECFPTFQRPTFCETDPRSTDDPAPSTTTATSPVVVVDATPPAVMPVSVSSATSIPEPELIPPVSESVEVAIVSPQLPVTGGHSLALACIAFGFVLVGATLRGPLARRGARR
jgi:hypothetical protein